MLKRIALATVLAFVTISPAVADGELVPWGESGTWKILKDPNHGGGCLVQTALSDGSYLRIGFGKKGDGYGYIASFNPAWSQFKDARKYDVTIKFADQTFVGQGTGEMFGKVPGVFVVVNNLDVLQQMAKADSVNLSAEGGDGLTVALTGSYDAIQKALVCQAE
jgi:hypothetical protein